MIVAVSNALRFNVCLPIEQEKRAVFIAGPIRNVGGFGSLGPSVPLSPDERRILDALSSIHDRDR
jgi:hypothetical protein